MDNPSGNAFHFDDNLLSKVVNAKTDRFTELVEHHAKLSPDTDLRSVNLDGVAITKEENLSSYNFTGSSLKNAVLRGVDLSKSKIDKTKFTGADLRDANLQGLDCRTSFFDNADLRKADLRGAQINPNQLASAKTTGVKLGELSFELIASSGSTKPESRREILPSFSDFLEEFSDETEDIPDYRDDPGAAFRFLYDSWVRRGGHEHGKRRHSVRKIKDWLGKGQVRSLETKLAGKTRLQYEDALRLITLFLTFWTRDSLTDRYLPYRQGDLKPLSEHLLENLFPDNVKTLLLPDRSRQVRQFTTDDGDVVSDSKLTNPSGTSILELFASSDALLTVSRAQTVIGADPINAITGFHRLMQELQDIDDKDQRGRILIWVLDLGLRDNNARSIAAIYNLHFLATQFLSIGLVEIQGRDKLLKWLHDNVCIIVGSLNMHEIDHIYESSHILLPSVPRDSLPWFQADRLFLESVPRRWLDPEIREAFGRREEDLWRTPTITAHLNVQGWDLDHSPEIDAAKNMRYLFHGKVRSPNDDLVGDESRCIELAEPGSRWSEVNRLAIQAACSRLDMTLNGQLSSIGPIEAVAMLRESGFAVLRLQEFLMLPNHLVNLHPARG